MAAAPVTAVATIDMVMRDLVSVECNVVNCDGGNGCICYH